MDDIPTTRQECSIEGCGGKLLARSWCSKHYYRWKRNGDPLATTRTPPIADDATEKHCPRCGNVKPLEMFGRRRGGKPKGYCESCEAKYQAEHAATEDGRDMRRQARSTWNDGNHGYFLQYRYGITIDDYSEMLELQGGRCAICGTESPGGAAKVWSVDHCHESTKVRGLLCGHCNRGLGQFKDSPARLRAAADYLESS